MADLGAIGRSVDADCLAHYALVFPLYAAARVQERRSISGVLGGVVTENGAPLKDCEVVVLWRHSMQPIARTWTDASGAWEISGFDSALIDSYVVIFKDKLGGTVYNDAAYALVVPT